ncbi:MAG TPA: 30S ribosomal protein S6--L-glutamate ligase, partial [Armatimonadota bacterium]|nr:30S ribosomal protein S6--L-glutamate ligase [Armatimonadota bacterium]
GAALWLSGCAFVHKASEAEDAQAKAFTTRPGKGALYIYRSELLGAALGLEVCGVDVLLSDSGPVVTEVNACPGLKAFEEATGVDLADRIIVAAEEVAKG